jgi:fibronectin-binding autotransporter adhesin
MTPRLFAVVRWGYWAVVLVAAVFCWGYWASAAGAQNITISNPFGKPIRLGPFDPNGPWQSVPAPTGIVRPIAVRTFDANGAPSFYPTQLQQAYGVNTLQASGNNSGAGQTVAIIDAYNYPNALAALNTFSAGYQGNWSLPAMSSSGSGPTFTQLNENGGTSLPTTTDSGWAGEEALDFDYVHTMAPKANIILYEANSASDADLYAAVNAARNNPAVSVITMSWGGGETSNDPSTNSYFTTPGTKASQNKGVTFCASTGDSGQPGGYPAFSPNVVAVGGTSLYLNSNNSYNHETAWSWNSAQSWGGGGGISTVEAKPSYQTSYGTANPSNILATTTARAIPDVSMLADPVTGVYIYDSVNGGWSSFYGGTSLASPCFAGLVADADGIRAAAGKGTLDGPTQTLPALYSLTGDFHDITSGNIDPSGNSLYSAGPGYDLATGIGSPIANLLVPDLANYGLAVTSAWAAPVSGNWSSASNWTQAPPNAVGAGAVINAPTAAALTITLDEPVTLGALLLGNSGGASVGYTLSGAGSNTLTFSNSGNGATISVTDGTHAINAPVVLADNLVVTGSGANPWTLTFGPASSITGSSSLTKNGARGLLILTGSNNYSGLTTVSQGTLQLGDGTAGHDGTPLAGNILDNAALVYNLFGSQTAACAISGSGSLWMVGGGTLGLSGSNTFSGGTTISAGLLQAGNNAALGAGSGRLAISGGALDVHGYSLNVGALSGTGTIDNLSGSGSLTVGNGGASSTFSGTIQNTAGQLSLAKTGTGTLTLTGSNTYSDGTTISGGLLRVNGALAGGGPVQVNGGGSLGGAGSISGAVTVAGGTSPSTYGTINLVDGAIGTLTLGSSLSMGNANAYSVLSLEFSNNGFDQIAATGPLTLSGSGIRVNLTSLLSGGTAAFGAYTILTAQSGVNPALFAFQTTGTTSESVGAETFNLLNSGGTAEEVQVTFGATSYSLAAAASAAKIHVNTAGGNTSIKVTVAIANTGVSGNDSLTYTGLNLSNSASLNGFSAKSGGPLALSGSDSNSGSFSTAVAGQYIFTPSVASATNTTLGTPANLSATTTASVSVYRLAANNSLSPINLGTVHVGGTFGTLAVNLQNTAANDGYSESLNASIAASGGYATTNSGSISLLSPGLSNNSSLTVGLGSQATATLGPVSGTATVTLTSDGTGSSGLGTTSLPPQAVIISGNVFSGSAVWNGTSGSWGSGTSGANWIGGVAPGTFSGFGNTDTATFNGSGSVTTVSFSGANPSLMTLNFSGSNYRLTDGTLTLASGSGMPAINIMDGTSQQIASTVAGTQGFLKNGPGTLILTGSNTYSGLTAINQGTLQLGDGTAGHDGVPLTGNIVNNAALVYNLSGSQTAAYAISGSGNLTKTGGGTLVLSGSNSYSGGTTISAGQLTIPASGSINNSSTVAVIAGASLVIGQATNGNTLTLNGGSLQAGLAIDATGTGGAITYSGGKVIHTFSSTGTSSLSLPLSITNASLLMVAGGGGGGSQYGGGGGAGGLIYYGVEAPANGHAQGTSYAIASGTTAVTVGAGGAGGVSGTPQNGSQGGNSTFGALTSIGGGYGAGDPNFQGANGGSGGAGGGASFGSTVGGAGTQGQGYSGGNALYGGGGGAGSAGGNTGGTGLTYQISATATWYGGGGSGPGEAAGQGGGGAGGASSGQSGSPGAANTGGGGGGGWSGAGGAGGSGIVVVSYPRYEVPATGNTLSLSGPITVPVTSTLDAFTAGEQIAVASAMSGSGGINIASSAAPGGVVSYTFAQSYSGDTTVNASGTLKMGVSSALPYGPGMGNLVLAGTLDLAGMTANVNGLSGSGTVTSSAVGSPILSAGNNNASSTFGGQIQNGSSAGLALAKTGTGTLMMTGSNTYGGGTTISGGLLQAGNNAALGAVSGPLAVGGGMLDVHGYHLAVGALNGTGTIDNLSGSGSLTVGNGGASSTFSGTIQNTAGQLSLAKTGTGTLTLTGANSYGGGTTIGGGLLLVNGALAGGGPVQVNGGGSLGGLGSIPGAVTVAGGTSPSTYGTINLVDGAIGTLALGSLLSMGNANAYSVLSLEFSSNGFDQIAATGPLTMSGSGVRVNLTSLLGGGTAAIGTYSILTAASGVNAGLFAFQSTGTTSENVGAETFNLLNSGGTAEQIQITAAPGSTSYSLAAAVSAAKIHVSTAGNNTTSSVTIAIANTGVSGNDSLTYTGLNVSNSASLNGFSPKSGGPLAISGLDTNSGNFSTAVAGQYFFTPSVASATNTTLGTPATLSGTTTAAVSVYRLATANTLTSPLSLGTVHAGGAFGTLAVNLQNTAANDGYSENLDALIAASGGYATTNSGSISLLGPGLSDSSSLTVGLGSQAAATPGPVSGTATVTLTSDGTGSSGLGATLLPSQAIIISGSVYRLAAANTLTSPVSLGTVHVGGAFGTLALNLQNTAANDGYSESLDASIAVSGGYATTNSGSISLLGPGLSDTSNMTVGLGGSLSTATPGPVSGTATVTLTSDGTGSSGLGTTALVSQAITITGTVFSGSAVWNATSGSWGSGAAGANWSGGAAPGTFSGFGNTDTATFNGTGSVTTVSLSGANPSLMALSFSGTNYVLSDGTLTLSGTSGMATVTVSETQSITSSLYLASSADMLVTGSTDVLKLLGRISGAYPLLKDGSGALVLSGSQNTYSGGTEVLAGTLIVTNRGALPDDSGLVVGPDASSLFAPASVVPSGVMGSRSPAAPAGVVAVPEPGTLALFAAGLAVGFCVWRKRKSGRPLPACPAGE